MGSGGKKTFIRYLKSEHTYKQRDKHTDRQTDRQTDILTYKKHRPRGPMLCKKNFLTKIQMRGICRSYYFCFVFNILCNLIEILYVSHMWIILLEFLSNNYCKLFPGGIILSGLQISKTCQRLILQLYFATHCS